MPFDATVVTAFIASPGDVLQHRDVIETAVHDWNRSGEARRRGVVLLPVRWELDAVAALGIDGQSILTQQLLEPSDIVLGVFHSRLGSATPRAASGTVEEIERAEELGLSVHVWIDAGPVPRDHDAGQLRRLKKYERRLQSRGLVPSFSGPLELRDKVTAALDHDVEQLLLRRVRPMPSDTDETVRILRRLARNRRGAFTEDKVFSYEVGRRREEDRLTVTATTTPASTELIRNRVVRVGGGDRLGKPTPVRAWQYHRDQDSWSDIDALDIGTATGPIEALVVFDTTSGAEGEIRWRMQVDLPGVWDGLRRTGQGRLNHAAYEARGQTSFEILVPASLCANLRVLPHDRTPEDRTSVDAVNDGGTLRAVWSVGHPDYAPYRADLRLDLPDTGSGGT